MSESTDQRTPEQVVKETHIQEQFTTAVRIAIAALVENKISSGNYGHNIAVATLAAEIAKRL